MPKIIDLKIEKMNLGGQGIGYLDGKVCFVDFVIPGEEIKAAMITEKKDYNVVKVIEVIRASPARIAPRCSVFKICGGCQLQHIDYPMQIELKKAMLIDTMRHIGRIQIDGLEVFCHEPWYYRNRTQLPVQKNGGFKMGYFKKGTHQVINHDFCYINQIEINRLVEILKTRIKDSKIEIYNEAEHRGNLRHVIIRRGTKTGEMLVTFVTKERNLPAKIYKGLTAEVKEIVGITQNINAKKTNRILGDEDITLVGRNFYTEHLSDKIFNIGPKSFFQINIPVFEMIIEKMKEEITGGTVLELYAGVGAIGISLAHLCNQVIAIEENPAAVSDGIKNAVLNNVTNINFIQGRAEDRINKVKDCDIIIMDPPRKGVDSRIINYFAKVKLRKIIYLSCHPATLARDVQLLLNQGFSIKKVYLFDMFPQTYHIETLVVLHR
ncbi:MAG: 23S rRNA (uracil(1939)-C(5))-methyltransferase RlmD [candidate division WOR-3 bacterium]